MSLVVFWFEKQGVSYASNNSRVRGRAINDNQAPRTESDKGAQVNQAALS